MVTLPTNPKTHSAVASVSSSITKQMSACQVKYLRYIFVWIVYSSTRLTTLMDQPAPSSRHPLITCVSPLVIPPDTASAHFQPAKVPSSSSAPPSLPFLSIPLFTFSFLFYVCVPPVLSGSISPWLGFHDYSQACTNTFFSSTHVCVCVSRPHLGSGTFLLVD